MNLLRTTQLCSRPPPKHLFRVSPFSTSADYTLKPQQPHNPSHSLTCSQTVKKQPGTSASPPTWPRPDQIQYQPKMANFVNLIGRIQMPIKFHATPNGKHIAATLIAQKDGPFIGNSFNSLLIPIVFQGDLAHTVACHVKRNDCVCVTGKLSLNPLPFVLSENQGKFYVVGNEIKFVQGLQMQDSNPIKKDVEDTNFVKEQVGNIKSSVDNNNNKDKVIQEWEEFHSKIIQGSVITSQDDDLTGAVKGFKELEEFNFEYNIEEMKIEPLKTEKKSPRNVGGTAKDWESIFNSWRDLVKNPTDWQDFREKKSTGSVKANYPDFKHKTNRSALWLDTAPNWVFPGLEGLNFDAKVQILNGNQANGGKGKNEDRWKSLVETPGKWWDNRSRKTNVKAPDFKHKETGEALWLDSSPEWALSQLPCSKNENTVSAINEKAYVT